MKRRGEQDYVVKRKGVNMFVFVVYLILGVYFINFPFKFYVAPEAVTNFDSWIVFVGGIFMLFGAINYFRVRKG